MKRFDRAAYRRADPSDQKKQLGAWPKLKGIETLSDMQATKLNALLPLGRDEALHWLSPRQLGRFGKLEGVASPPSPPNGAEFSAPFPGHLPASHVSFKG